METREHKFASAESKKINFFQKVKPVLQVKPLYADHFEEKYYEPGILPHIAGAAMQILEITSPNDTIIMPGRSMIQIARYLRILGERDESYRRTLYVPSFSKGGLLSYENNKEIHTSWIRSNPDDCIHSIAEAEKQVAKWHEDKKREGGEGQAIRELMKHFENNPYCYYDFQTQKVTSFADFKCQPENSLAYQNYLKQTIGLTPQFLSNCTGKVFIMDSILSGDGLRGFLKIITDWCEEEKCPMTRPFHIWNFGKSKTDANFVDGHIIMDEEVWMELSYNYIPDESTFFPCWAWNEKALWQPDFSKAKDHYEEMASYVTTLQKKPNLATNLLSNNITKP